MNNLNNFGFELPDGLTRFISTIEDRHKCSKCNGWLPDHEFNETCEWQCQGCGLLVEIGEWHLVRGFDMRIVCNKCYIRLSNAALRSAGLIS